MITPAAVSTARASKLTFPATSRAIASAGPTPLASGRSNWKIVISWPVEALVSAPKRAPSRSKVRLSSPSGKFLDPRKAICSTKWEKPRWS
jgi:hypothetical protein